MSVKQLKELSEKRGLKTGHTGYTKAQLIARINQGVIIRAHQLREIAAFYKVPVRKSNAPKDYLISQLVKYAIIEPDSKDKYASAYEQYKLVKANSRLESLYRIKNLELKAIKPKEIDKQKLQEFVNKLAPVIKDRMAYDRKYKSVVPKHDKEYNDLSEKYAGISSIIQTGVPF
jgi:hypothetical protein